MFSAGQFGRAECLSSYALRYRDAKAEVHANLWPHAGLGLATALMLSGLPGSAGVLGGSAFASLSYQRYQAHLKLQPLVLLYQARVGYGAKLNALALDLAIDPARLAGIIRDLDRQDVFCGAGFMNEREINDQVALELRRRGR